MTVTMSLEEKGFHYSIFPVVHQHLNADSQCIELRKPGQKVQGASRCVCEVFPESLRPSGLQSNEWVDLLVDPYVVT